MLWSHEEEVWLLTSRESRSVLSRFHTLGRSFPKRLQGHCESR